MEQKEHQLAIIVGYSRERVIGLAGKIPWHFPEDMRYFRRMTMGHSILMGHKTYRSIGKPLKGRRNIVLSHQKDLELPGCEVFHDLSTALNAAYQEDECPFIIGGSGLYEQAMSLATHLYVTEIDISVEGDTWFPKIHLSAWKEDKRISEGTLTFVTYVKYPNKGA